MKGTKFYGVISEDKNSLVFVRSNKEDSIEGMDKRWPYLVELEVTKVWRRNPVLEEINNEKETS